MGRYATVCIAVALLLAGCVGGQGGTTSTTGDAGTTAAETTTATGTAGGETTAAGGGTTTAETTASSGGTGTLDFYVSDERNAMDDFAHLNVTIAEVGVRRADGGKWTTYDVDGRTADLTRLAGPNATRLGTFAVENGTYDTVFVRVSEVNGTLANGERVRVKLPSEKLQIHQQFAVAPNQSVDYVFDISVFEAGKSGKYILKPVISESGTDEPIESVDGEDEKREGGGKDDESDGNDGKAEGEDGGNEAAENDDGTEPALNATFVGDVTPGGNATVSVSHDGTPVANATVAVNGEVVGETDADGNLTFAVPDREELEVEVETEDGSVTVKRRLEDADRGDGNGGNGNGGDN